MFKKYIGRLIIPSLLTEIRTEFTIRKNTKRLYPSIKNRVKKRDGYKCVKCSSTYRISVDHILPRIKGGSNEDDNLQSLCHDCHRIKTKNENRKLKLLNQKNNTIFDK